jgi:hypothetical protein
VPDLGGSRFANLAAAVLVSAFSNENTLPGFMMLLGSSACLICRITDTLPHFERQIGLLALTYTMFTGAGAIHRQRTRIEPPDEVLGGGLISAGLDRCRCRTST